MVLHKHVVLLRKHVVLLHKHVVVLCNSMKHRLDKQLELPHRPVVFMGTCGNHQSLLHKVATHTYILTYDECIERTACMSLASVHVMHACA